MKIKLLSDIHFEFKPDYFPAYVYADVLVLAGDIAVGATKIIQAIQLIYERSCGQGTHIIFVFGNHEFYHQDFDKTKAEVKEWFADCKFVHILDNSVVKINDVTFIGSTLWTNFRDNSMYLRDARDMISDFALIRKDDKPFLPVDAKKEFEASYQFIKHAYETIPGKKVIVTHFLPAVECIDPQYCNASQNLNSYFANDLSNWIGYMVDVPYWFFGHTHSTVDVTLGEVRCMANPYGYHGGNKDFIDGFEVEV